MDRKTFAGLTVVALAGAIAIPSIALGNARRTNGTLAGLEAAQTPFLAKLSGAAEVVPGDPDGTGAAAVTFDSVDATNDEVCWDLSYANIAAPTAAHIHRGAVGIAGSVVVDFGGPLGGTGHAGCALVAVALSAEIQSNPAGFYVNVHNEGFAGGAIRGQLAEGPSPAGATFLLPEPLRAYDSRDNSGVRIAAGETRTVSVATAKNLAGASLIAVPPGAKGAIVTLTITDTLGDGGFLKLYSAASPLPATSSINWTGVGQNDAVSTQVAVDPAGQVKVTAGVNSTHFVVDVVGYLY